MGLQVADFGLGVPDNFLVHQNGLFQPVQIVDKIGILGFQLGQTRLFLVQMVLFLHIRLVNFVEIFVDGCVANDADGGEGEGALRVLIGIRIVILLL